VPPVIQIEIAAHDAKKPDKKKNRWSYESWEEHQIKLVWRAGFIVRADMCRPNYDDGTPTLVELLSELFEHPSARLLEELNIGDLCVTDSYDYSPVIELIGKDKRPSLRRLYVADFSSENCELSWSEFGDFSGIWTACPNLEEVRIHAAQFSLGTLELPKAKTFIVETGGLEAEDVKAIASAKWPALEKLEIWFGAEEYGAGGDVELIGPILEAKGLSKVRELGLKNSEFADDICKALPGSKIAKQIEVLDLSLGVMSDAGAEALVSKAGAFPKLKKLDVSDNYLSDDGVKLLDKLGVEVEVGDQDEGDEDDGEIYRYVQVGE
jgi:hypothetical protein